mgnify:CR=1 FL=1
MLDETAERVIARMRPHARSLLLPTGVLWGAAFLSTFLLGRMEWVPWDAVVLSIGVNDVTGGCSPKAWRQAMQQLLQLLRSRFGVRQLVLLRVPPMHAFTGLPQPLRWYMGYRARRFNLQLEALVAEYPDCLLSEELTLAGPLLAADGFHPGALIYKRWAAVIADLLRHCRK